MKITADKAKAFAIIAGVAVAGFVAFKLYRGAAETLDAVGNFVSEDINPASSENFIYRGVNFLTGGDNEQTSLGSRIYDFFNEDYKP